MTVSDDRLDPQDWMTAPATRAVVAALAAEGATVRFVGGCVRDALLARMAATERAGRLEDFDVDAAVEQAKAEPRSQRGDLWTLGEHRLLKRWVTFEEEVEGAPDEAMLDHPQQRVGARMDLERALAKLPKGARTVLMLHDIEGYQHDEIAELTGIAVGTSKAQLHRARKLMKEWLS